MGNKTRRSRDNGTTEAHGHSPAEEAGQPRAEAGQVPEAHGGEEAEDDVVIDIDYRLTSSALKRLVTEPGETWVLETEETPEGAMKALAAWSQTRGVTLLVFGPGERFSLLSTKPGDTVVLFTANPQALNAEVLTAWAQSRGLQLAVMPNEAALQHLDDAALEQMGLQRKNRVLVFPGGPQVPPNLKGPA